MKRLEGQTAIITGSSSGIGKAVAIEMAAEGANVVVNYPGGDPGLANDTMAKINAEGGKAMCCKADVSNEADVQAMFAETVKNFGTVDILVNNAGLQKDSRLVDMTVAQWDLVLNVNLKGQFLCAREAAKEFIRRGMVPSRSKALGKIICMSSVHEVIPWAGHVNYAASKGGVMLLMKSMAQELAPLKIRVNSIGPGAIETPINTSAWDTPEALKSLLTLIPYGRAGKPTDIAKAAVWLASDESDYVTGTTLFVDGGMTLYPGFATGG
jgi:glucose 1-dehydrogenase